MGTSSNLVRVLQESKSSVSAQEMEKGEHSWAYLRQNAPHTKRTLSYLVHGFWADGSGWSKVIPPLQAQGHFVIAGQHAITSLAADVDTTRQILAELDGHSVI
jgi:hypothetical protein